MKIEPLQDLKNKVFYNNICMIVCIFCIICFITSLFFQISSTKEKTYYLQVGSQNELVIGPFFVKNKSQIYKITANFPGYDTSCYISGEVLDEDKDTLYEFSKDLWHESGYDYTSADNKMVAYLTFNESGKYYLQFRFEEVNSMDKISITIQSKRGSYVLYFQIGTLFFIFTCIAFCYVNRKWFSKDLFAKVLGLPKDTRTWVLFMQFVFMLLILWLYILAETA